MVAADHRRHNCGWQRAPHVKHNAFMWPGNELLRDSVPSAERRDQIKQQARRMHPRVVVVVGGGHLVAAKESYCLNRRAVVLC